MTTLKAGTLYRVRGTIENFSKVIFSHGELGVLEPTVPGSKHWHLKSPTRGAYVEAPAVFEEWIKSGRLTEVTPSVQRMRVPIEGGKYTILTLEGGRVAVNRFRDPWMGYGADLHGAKMLLAVGFELVCLRRIAAEAIKLVEYADKGDISLIHGFIGGLADVIRQTEGLTDVRQNLKDPGEV